MLARLRHYRQTFKKRNGDNLPAFYKYIVGDETPDVGENRATLEAPMKFVHDYVDSYAGRANYTKWVLVADLFVLDEKDAGPNDIYLDCLQTVSKNIVNDHILCMILDKIDHPDKSKHGIKSCRQLLLACLLPVSLISRTITVILMNPTLL